MGGGRVGGASHLRVGDVHDGEVDQRLQRQHQRPQQLRDHAAVGRAPPRLVLVVVVAAAVVGAAADRLGELAALVDLADEEVEPLLDRRPVGALAAELVLPLVRDEVQLEVRDAVDVDDLVQVDHHPLLAVGAVVGVDTVVAERRLGVVVEDEPAALPDPLPHTNARVEARLLVEDAFEQRRAALAPRPLRRAPHAAVGHHRIPRLTHTRLRVRAAADRAAAELGPRPARQRLVRRRQRIVRKDGVEPAWRAAHREGGGTGGGGYAGAEARGAGRVLHRLGERHLHVGGEGRLNMVGCGVGCGVTCDTGRLEAGRRTRLHRDRFGARRPPVAVARRRVHLQHEGVRDVVERRRRVARRAAVGDAPERAEDRLVEGAE